MMLTAIFLATLILPAYSVPQEADLKLEYVQMLWRHGDRSPMIFYPNDPHRDAWPQGPGMLTQQGMRQQYHLGKYLRARYQNFMSDYYLKNETYIISSDIDRAIESASCNMASFYEPSDWQVWERSLNWQPVPIHTLDADEDHYLDVLWETCPRWVAIDNLWQNSQEYTSYVSDFEDLFSDFSRYTGLEVNMTNAGLLYDNLICVSSHNLSLPEWADPDFLARVENVTDFAFFNIFRTEEQQRLLGGSLFKSIREIFAAKINKSDELYSNKMMAYSGHDTTVMGLASLLGVFNNMRPPYVTTMIFELFSDSEDNHYVKLSYHNSSAEDPYPLRMKFCGTVLCPFGEFFENSVNLTVANWKEECGQTDLSVSPLYYKTSRRGNVIRFLVTASLFVVFVLLIFLVIECYCLYIKRRVLDPRKLKLEISFTSGYPAPQPVDFKDLELNHKDDVSS